MMILLLLLNNFKIPLQIAIDRNLLNEFEKLLGEDSPGVSKSQKITVWIIQYVKKLKR